MRIARLPLLALLATVAMASTALADAPKASTTTASTKPAAALPRLVFFMNPNGMPCQMQDKVLKDMAPELKGKAELVYYKTTIPADIAKFQQYGIRSLPSLVLVDASGKELRRATPGIQSAAQVRDLLKP